MTDTPLSFRLRSAAAGGPVARALTAAGLVASAEPAHVCWDDEPAAPDEFKAVSGRYFNRLPGSDAMAMNGRLTRAIASARKRAEQAGQGERFDFYPRTFLLPDDVPEYHAAARRMPRAPWIWRFRATAPPGKAGILASPHDAGADARYLIQEYVAEPHLLDGYKYTLRFFLAVTSLEPLVAWLSSDGFCRFASQPYSYAPEKRGERHRHLTTPEALLDDATVSPSWQNVTLDGYRARLRSEGVDEARLFEKIEKMLQAALVAVREPVVRLAADDKVPLEPGQFELFAADVLVDEALQPWLLGFHPTPALAVGAARNLPVAAREDVFFERLAKELFTLVGALEPAPPPALPTGLPGWSAWLSARDARRGGFQRLFPAPQACELLANFEVLRASDLQLAYLSRPPEQRQFLVQDAVASALDGGLVVAGERGKSALLEGPAAAIWQALSQGESVEKLAERLPAEEPAEAREARLWSLLTDWFRAGFIGWQARAPVRQRPPTRWNGGRTFVLDGLKLLVRGGGPDTEALLHPLLAPFECSPPGAPDRVYDLVNHDDGWALFDSEGKRRWRGIDATLGAALLELLRAESMRAARRLGAFEALLLPEKRALIVPARGLFRGLSEALAPLGLESAGAPVFVSAREGLEVSTRASGEDGLSPNHLVLVEVDRARPESSGPCAPFAALQALLANARGEAQLTPAGAATLTAALARTSCDALVAHGVGAAAKRLAELLSGSAASAAAPAASSEAPRLSIAR